MDNQRLLIWALFAFLAWMTYQTWVADYAPRPAQPVTEQTADTLSTPPEVAGDDDELPAITETTAAEALPSTPDAADGAVAGTDAPTITVSTDVFDIVISTKGGTLQGATLKKYPVAKDTPDVLVQLLGTQGEELGLIESGVRAAGGAAEATHLETFTAAGSRYELGDADELIVPLTWQDPNGVTVEKRFRFSRGSYAIGLEQVVSNGTEAAWRGAEYVRIKRHSAEQERSMFDVDSYSFIGPIVYDGDKSEKLKRDDLIDDGKYEYTAQQGWIGSIQHHFLSAVVPAPGVEYKYDVAVNGDVAISSSIRRNLVAIEPGASETISVRPIWNM